TPDLSPDISASQGAPFTRRRLRYTTLRNLHPVDANECGFPAARRCGINYHATIWIVCAEPLWIFGNVGEEAAHGDVMRQLLEGLRDVLAGVANLAHTLPLGLRVIAPKDNAATLDRSHLPCPAILPGVELRRNRNVCRPVCALDNTAL